MVFDGKVDHGALKIHTVNHETNKSLISKLLVNKMGIIKIKKVQKTMGQMEN